MLRTFSARGFAFGYPGRRFPFRLIGGTGACPGLCMLSPVGTLSNANIKLSWGPAKSEQASGAKLRCSVSFALGCYVESRWDSLSENGAGDLSRVQVEHLAAGGSPGELGGVL